MVKRIKKVCVVLINRANYGRIRPVMSAIQADTHLEMQLIVGGSMLLERFGNTANQVEANGFKIDARIYMEVEGARPETMGKSVGLGVIDFTSEFQRLEPDLVLLIGDRYEALSAAIAAAMINIPIAHIQGGEVSGSIDESIRHVISKFSQLHFPATARSAEFLCRMGERKENVHNVGCPVGDVIKRLDGKIQNAERLLPGVGANVDFDEPFFMVIFHPVTTDVESQGVQAKAVIQALAELAHPTIWVWPNIDAGSDQISKELRIYRENNKAPWLRVVKHIDSELFLKLMKRAKCLVGNSSSFLRDSSFMGTPVVLLGDRQFGREHSNNLVACRVNSRSIVSAIESQVAHGPYAADSLYGDGTASDKIVHHIKGFVPYAQKSLAYIDALPNT